MKSYPLILDLESQWLLVLVQPASKPLAELLSGCAEKHKNRGIEIKITTSFKTYFYLDKMFIFPKVIAYQFVHFFIYQILIGTDNVLGCVLVPGDGSSEQNGCNPYPVGA